MRIPLCMRMYNYVMKLFLLSPSRAIEFMYHEADQSSIETYYAQLIPPLVFLCPLLLGDYIANLDSLDPCESKRGLLASHAPVD